MPPPDDEAWYDNLEKLKEFKEKNGHCRVPNCHLGLGQWRVSNQRHIQNMPKHRVDALDAIGFCWSARDETWETMYAELKKFQEENGHCLVPATNGKLGRWVRVQGWLYNKGNLSKERFQKLQELGFTWVVCNSFDPSGERWQSMFANLQKFQEEHGHCRVPRADGKLGRWVSTQRTVYHQGKLNKEKLQKLQELGFTWDVHATSGPLGEDWLAMFANLKKFHQENGHCRGGAAANSKDSDLDEDDDDDDDGTDEMESIEETQQEADDEQPSDEEMTSKPPAMKLKRATKCQGQKLQAYSRKWNATPTKKAAAENDDTESTTEDKAYRRRTAQLGMESEKEEGEQSIQMEVSSEEDNDDTSSDIQGEIEEEDDDLGVERSSIGIPRRTKSSQLQKLHKLAAAQQTIIQNQIERLNHKRTIIRSQRRTIRKQKRMINMRQKSIQELPNHLAALQQQVETIQQELADLEGSRPDL
ncbi:helicase [Seminavis robusta]|uniref:Helicase n=1 Tax=Seminavis robusta TaxID=568900 RepID=A0A9N8DF79_9STRA|nr:helicase [Seminavis robusta]|eukprot:Sro128_g061340.1 helicase (473) ;mRNA; r:86116-87731